MKITGCFYLKLKKSYLIFIAEYEIFFVVQNNGRGYDIENSVDFAACRHLGRCAVLGNFTAVHQQNGVGIVQSQIQIVQNHNYGFALAVQLLHQIHNVQLMVDVQIGGGFVQHQELCVLSQCHGNEGSLSFAARQIAETLISQIRHSCRFHGVFDDFLVLGGMTAVIGEVGKPAVSHQR